MKKIFLLLIICLLSVNVFAKVNVTSVKLDESSISIDINETETLKATVLPKNATNKAVTWKSSNTSIATVSTTGVVTGKKKGSCNITVTTKDQNKTAKCKVTVSSIICPTKVTLNKTSATIKVGETLQLKATVLPSNATDKSVEWESNKKSIATVSSKGLVKGIKAGVAKIEVETEKGDKKAYCTVTVIQPVTGVKLNKSSLSLGVGQTETLTATVSPSNATNKNVTWSSSDKSVATVDNKGKVTAKGIGTAKVYVVTKDGSKKATCSVNVIGLGNAKITVLRNNKAVKDLQVKIKNSSNTYSAYTNTNGIASYTSIKEGTYYIYIDGNKEGSLKVVNGKTATSTINLQENTITFMFYANSYNLDNGLCENLRQMYKYGSTDKVNIVVCYKTSTSNGVYRGKILKSNGSDLTYGLAKMSNMNFGNPNTLKDFCNWAMTNYPADEYVLDLWDHGTGWTPYWDTRAINHEEEYNYDCLEIWELHKAVEDLGIDAICMDACMMQMLEVLTIIKEDFKISMASENDIPSNGYNYTNLLKGLNDYSTISSAFTYFAKLQLSDYYWEYYDTDIQITDLSKINNVNKSIKNISDYLVKGSYGQEISDARLELDTLSHFSKDLETFLKVLNKSINKSQFTTLVSAYKTAKKNALIYNGTREEIEGFAVNIPNKIQYNKYFGVYGDTEFAEGTNWDKVLELQ